MIDREQLYWIIDNWAYEGPLEGVYADNWKERVNILIDIIMELIK